MNKRKLIVLDLDETLISSQNDVDEQDYDFIVDQS